MLNSRTDPAEAHEIWRARVEEAHRQFSAREISLDVYRATLHGLGYRGREIESEVNLHWLGDAVKAE